MDTKMTQPIPKFCVGEIVDNKNPTTGVWLLADEILEQEHVIKHQCRLHGEKITYTGWRYRTVDTRKYNKTCFVIEEHLRKRRDKGILLDLTQFRHKDVELQYGV